MPNNSIFRHWIWIGSIITLLGISGCSLSSQTNPPDTLSPAAVPSATTQVEPSVAIPTSAPEATEDLSQEWTDYKNENFQFSFAYPSTWYGPDVYESDGTLRLAIGSDVVYPYGTSREDQISTIPDAYYITIQYNQNQNNLTWDDYVNSGWITSYLELRDLEEGGSYSTIRSLAIKVRDVTLGSFQGVEYIFTLPDTAQTERVYGREIVVFDQDLNMLQITGYPNMVEISDESNWKADYQRVDESYLENFERIAQSITNY